ncbi:MAG TPA: recombination mediator RecR [Bacteroidales bacterium]|nr:recombination mediator RecR [Bacteroidales bacterium]HNS46353.1 recombination mediator RecR [Bacteroidales bacterium]
MEIYPSKLLEDAVRELSRLPGIGKRTALRLALFLLREDAQASEALAGAILRLRQQIRYCQQCYNISDTDVCPICSNPKRNRSILCVVEDSRDVLAIENTAQYTGIYHVLGGVISPVDGIGPHDLTIDMLERKVQEQDIAEVIFALPATIEGDTTNFYLFKRLQDYNIRFSIIARGVAIGDDLEYTDELTLGRSILNRTAYEGPLPR